MISEVKMIPFITTEGAIHGVIAQSMRSATFRILRYLG